MVRAIGEIDELLGFLENEFGGVDTGRCLMARIRRRACIAAPELFRQSTEGDIACPASIAYASEPSVPVFQRQPDLEENMRLTRGCDHSSDLAERRQVSDRISPAWRCKRSRGDWLSRGNRCVREPVVDQARAWLRRSVLRSSHHNENYRENRNGMRVDASSSPHVFSISETASYR